VANKRKHYCLTAGLPLFISVGPPAQCALGPIDHKKTPVNPSLTWIARAAASLWKGLAYVWDQITRLL